MSSRPLRAGRRAGRSGRRRSGPGWSSPRRWRSGSRSRPRTRCAAARPPRPCAPSASSWLRRRRAPPARTSGRMPSTKYSCGRPTRSPLTPPLERRRIVGHRPVDRWSSRAGRGRRWRPSRMGAVGHVARHRPDLVERRGVGDHAVAGDPAVGRLEADDAAVRRRLADRAAGVGAERAEALAARPPPPPSRPTSRPGRASCPTGCGSPPKRRVLGRRAHRELVQLVLPTQHRAGLAQRAGDGGVVGRDEVLEDARAGGGAHALGADDVLDRDRDAVERPQRLARRAAADRPPRACSSASSGGHGDEAVQRRLRRLDARQHRRVSSSDERLAVAQASSAPRQS